jgi:hypothetical protein
MTIRTLNRPIHGLLDGAAAVVCLAAPFDFGWDGPALGAYYLVVAIGMFAVVALRRSQRAAAPVAEAD